MLVSTFVIVEKNSEGNVSLEFRDTPYDVVNRVANISTKVMYADDIKGFTVERIFKVNEFGEIEYLNIVFKHGVLALEITDKY